MKIRIIIFILIIIPRLLISQEINLNNKNIIDENYISIQINNFFVIKNKINSSSKYGLIDKNFNTISPLIFDTIYEDQTNNNIIFKKNDFYGKFDIYNIKN